MIRYTFYFLLLPALLGNCSRHKGLGNKTRNSLLIPKDGYKVKLFQRHKTKLPSDSGVVFLEIGDITLRQTVVTIKGDEQLIFRHSIPEHSRQSFVYNGANYEVECTKLVNKLLGEDYGVFTLRKYIVSNKSTGEKLVDVQIEDFIRRIEASPVIFIRNGQAFSPTAAGDHLRSKWRSYNGTFLSLDEFIETIATVSSATGEPYKVQLEDGRVLNASEWYKTLRTTENN